MYKECVYLNKRPTIFILDSGVGGLFIYSKVQKIFPYIYYLYLFDNKFFPYGERSEEFITKRVIFLIEVMRKQHLFDIVIIACNTISVVSLRMLRIYFNFPIIGIVPEIQLASRCTKNGVIGVLATYRTVQHHCIIELVKRFSYQHKIILLGTSKLVRLAEFKVYGKEIVKSELQIILDPWLRLKNIPDTIVLGCTHFSWLKKELKEVLPGNTYLIDSVLYIKDYISMYLNKQFKIKKNDNYENFNQNIVYCTKDTPEIMQLRSVLLCQYNFFSFNVLLV